MDLTKLFFLCLITLSLGHSFNSDAQASSEDIVQKVKKLLEETDPKSRFKSVYAYADEYFDQEAYDTALYIFQYALESATKDGSQKGIATASRKIGDCYVYIGEYEKGIPYSDEAIRIFKELGDKNWLRKAYHTRGRMESVADHKTKALQAYFEALRLTEELGKHEQHAELLLDIGSIETEMEHHDKAEAAYLKCIEISLEHDHPNYLNSAYNNLGVHYKLKDDFDKCIEYFKKSRDLMMERGDSLKATTVIINMALVYAEMGQFDASKAELDRALEIQKKFNDRMGILNTLTSATYNYSQSDNVSPGISYGKEALELAQEFKSFYHLRYIHEFLSIIYEKKDDPKNAFVHYKQMVAFQDSLDQDENEKIMKELETKYETEKKETEIKNLNLTQALNEKEIDRKQNQIDKEKAHAEKEKAQKYMLFGGLGLAICLALVLFRSIRQKKKDNDIILSQKKEVEAQRDFANEQKILAEDRQAQVEEQNREILDSINYAKRIQTAILPPNKLVKAYLTDSFIMYEPKDIVAGDFYWMEPQENKVLFAAADCTGHGVPGAMVSVVCNNGLNRSVREYGLNDPGQILDKTREIVIEEFEKSEEEVKDGMDIALCSLQHSLSGGKTVKYAGANNPLWIIRAGSEEIEEIKADKQPIGKYAEPKPYTSHTIELNKGDTFYIFSDGYADQFGGPRGKKFKAANFKRLLLNIQHETMAAQRQQIIDAFNQWKGDIEQLDDVCVIGVRV